MVSFDVLGWLSQIPLDAVYNFLFNDGIPGLLNWFKAPFTYIVCWILEFSKSTTICPEYAGYFLMLPVFALIAWGMFTSVQQKSFKLFMVIIAGIIAIFIIGITLMFLGKI